MSSQRYPSRLESRAGFFASTRDECLSPRVRLECNPEIPVAPGEEHWLLDTSLDEVYWPCSHSPWNSPGQNTGVGSLSLLWGIFLTQGWNPGLLHCRQILSCLSHQGSPLRCSPKNGYDGNSYVMHFEPQLKKEGLFFSSYKLTTPGPFWLSIHHSSDGSQKLSVAYVARFSPPEA